MTSHDQVRAAVLARTSRWDVVLSLLEQDRIHPHLHLLDGIASSSCWRPCADAAKAALHVERDVGLPGLAELVVRHEWLKTRATR